MEAERKYYDNLGILEDKLARLTALQVLSENLLACSDPGEALEHLVEVAVLHMGVEKAAQTRKCIRRQFREPLWILHVASIVGVMTPRYEQG